MLLCDVDAFKQVNDRHGHDRGDAVLRDVAYELRKRLRVDEAAERVYNFLHTLTLEAQMFARACGKTDVHSLEPEDLCALTVEASAMAKVPLAGTNYIPGQTEERALAEMKAMFEKFLSDGGNGGRNV